RATRVPLLAGGPGKIKADQVNDNLVDFTDMLPTLLEAAGAKNGATPGLDGPSLYGQLVNRESVPREWVFCYYHPQLYSNIKAYWAHDKTWKLNDDGRFFNTVTDPQEQRPILDAELTDEARTARAKLQVAMDKCM